MFLRIELWHSTVLSEHLILVYSSCLKFSDLIDSKKSKMYLNRGNFPLFRYAVTAMSEIDKSCALHFNVIIFVRVRV